MKDRLITAAGALCALALLIGLLYAPAQQVPVSRPISTEGGPNGYLGVKRWLEYGGVRSLSLRRRIPALEAEPAVPDSGNILVLTLPASTMINATEFAWLASWVDQGNTLLVLAALDDSPNWIYLPQALSAINDLESLTGLYFLAVEDDEGDVLQTGEVLVRTPLEIELLPGHPLTDGIEPLKGVSDSITAIWEPLLDEESGSVFRLGVETAYGADALWQLPRGAGQIVISASGSLLSNRMLGEGGNADLLARLISLHLAPDGVVIFDDFHQGLSEIYDATAFYADERFHATLGFLFLFWLLYLVGTSARLQPGRDQAAQPRQADLVRAMGGFMGRKLGSADAGRLMVDGWLEQLRRDGRIDGDSPWEQLARMPLVPKPQLEQLRQDYARLGEGHRVNLKTLHNLLLDIKRTLE